MTSKEKLDALLKYYTFPVSNDPLTKTQILLFKKGIEADLDVLEIIRIKNPNLSTLNRYGDYETYKKYEYAPPYDFFPTKEEYLKIIKWIRGTKDNV